jgi:phosphatidylglycerophosphate synthase
VIAVMDRDRYRAEWSTLHGGLDASSSRLIDGWLGIMYLCAAPFVRRRVSPTTVTILALVCAAIAVAASGFGRWGALAAMVLILMSTLLDGVDGAVAVMSDRASAWGSVLDSTADRVSDLCFYACAAVVGVPLPLIATMAVSTLVHESVRARAAAVGMPEAGVLTVWERPSRAVTVLLILGANMLFPDQTWTSTAGGAVGAGLALIGLVQLLVVVHRRLAVPAQQPARSPG